MKRQPSVHDVSWFLDMHRTGQLDLDPPYQRKSVWTTADRKFFLDTIFRNYPCPPIFLHKSIDDAGLSRYHVVDGKQRLETIIMFSNNILPLDKGFGDQRFEGKKIKDLGPDEKKIFWNYSIPVDYIMELEQITINQIFDRVNRNSRNLQPQELRHAKFDGWFITEVEAEVDNDSFWEDIKVSTKTNSKRMKNYQFASELLLIIIDNKIVGFDQDYLDEKYGDLDSKEDLNFELDEYNNSKQRIKDYIKEIELENKAITTYAKTVNNQYTVWAIIALELFPKSMDSKKFAQKYASFMAVVNECSSKKLEDLNTQYGKEIAEHAYRYFNNSRGASTDLTQREARLNALEEFLK